MTDKDRNLEERTSDSRIGIIPVPFAPEAWADFTKLQIKNELKQIERGEKIFLSSTFYVNGMSRTYYDPKTGRIVEEHVGNVPKRHKIYR